MSTDPIDAPPPLTRLGRLRAWAVREVGVVAALLVISGGLLAFLSIADEIDEGGAFRIDRIILYGLRSHARPTDPIGPKWLETGAADLTALGSITDLALIVLLIAGFFIAVRRFRQAAILVAAPLSGALVGEWIKYAVDRPRPPAALHAVEVMNPSFPSGHALLSAVVYLTLAVLVARYAERRRVKVYVVAAGVTLSLLVGCSRVYLGVHWPTDVLAGWSLGAAWALAWWLLAVWWDRAQTSAPPAA